MDDTLSTAEYMSSSFAPASNIMQLQFAPDSPLFMRQVLMYGSDLERLGNFLKTLIDMMRKYEKHSIALAKSASVLGDFMKTGLGNSDSFSHLQPFIKKFGDIFCDMSNSEEILAESLESTFSSPLEKFYVDEIKTVQQLQSSYISLRENSESSVLRYLQSDASNFGRGATQNSLEQRAHDLIIHKRKFELARFDLVHKINEVESRKTLEISEACVSGMYALRSHHRICESRFHSCDTYVTELQKNEEREKENLELTMRPLEKKRRDMSAVLEAMVERVEMASSSATDSNSSNTTASSLSSSVTDRASGGAESSKTVEPEKIASTQSNSVSSSLSSSSFSSLSRMSYNFIDGLTKNMGVVGGDGNRGNRRQSTGTHSAPSQPAPTTRGNITSAKESALRGWRQAASFDTTDLNPLHDALQTDTCENCEARMKALDYSELNRFYLNAEEYEPAGLVKQGYLWKRSEKQLIETWKRQWFVLDDTKLYYIKEVNSWDGTFEVNTVCADLMLASVREVTDIDLPFCFKVSNANISSITVQAEGQKEYQQWLQELRGVIEKRLTSGFIARQDVVTKKTDNDFSDGVSSSHRPRFHSVDSTEDNMPESVAGRRQRNAALIRSILESNPQCAECERSHPAPEWVSLNLGCVICIDCSGVHRAMGVHVSKMRSLKLDDLEPEEYEVLQLVGNEKSNSIWEYNLPSKTKKPSPQSTYSVREKYIRDKYIEKQYLNLKYSDMNKCFDDLVRACESNDVSLLLECIAIGGTTCLVSSRHPLHVAASRGARDCCVLLVVSGIDILELNEDHVTAAEVARLAGHEELARILQDKEASIKMSKFNETVKVNDNYRPSDKDDVIVFDRSSSDSTLKLDSEITGASTSISDDPKGTKRPKGGARDIRKAMKGLMSKAFNSSDDLQSLDHQDHGDANKSAEVTTRRSFTGGTGTGTGERYSSERRSNERLSLDSLTE